MVICTLFWLMVRFLIPIESDMLYTKFGSFLALFEAGQLVDRRAGYSDIENRFHRVLGMF